MMRRTESLGTAMARLCSREIKTKDAFHLMQNSGLNFQEISSDECNSNFSEFSAIYKNFRTSLTGNFVSIRPSSWNLWNFLFNGSPFENSTISGISGLGLSRLCSVTFEQFLEFGATFCCSTFCTFCLSEQLLSNF